MKSIQTFLEEFNYIPFEEKPKILLQAWYNFFAIQHAQPKDSNELFQKLLEDLKKLAKYVNSPSRDHFIFFEDNEDYSVQYKEYLENSCKEIAPSNSNQEKKNPPQDSDIQLYCMHDNVDDLIESALNFKLLSINLNSQHLDKKEQEVKNVVKQPAERRTHSSAFDVCDNHSDIFSDSDNDDDISSDENAFEDIEYVEASLPDPEIVSIEEENFKLKRGGKGRINPLLEKSIYFLPQIIRYHQVLRILVTTRKGTSVFLKNYLSMIPFLFPVNEEFDFDNSSFPRPPPEPPDAEFDLEHDAGKEILAVMNDNDEFECLDPRIEIDEKDDYFPFMLVI
nr:hypothetical protein [Tanacetum cinerariifolium]